MRRWYARMFWAELIGELIGYLMYRRTIRVPLK